MKHNAPSPTGPNGKRGRGRDGKFLPGNKAAKGNPLARKAQELRVALFASVSPSDLQAIVGKLIGLAKAGDVQAAKVVLDRVLGPPVELDLLERLEKLEAAIAGREP
jgi:hypothetical protein